MKRLLGRLGLKRRDSLREDQREVRKFADLCDDITETLGLIADRSAELGDHLRQLRVATDAAGTVVHNSPRSSVADTPKVGRGGGPHAAAAPYSPDDETEIDRLVEIGDRALDVYFSGTFKSSAQQEDIARTVVLAVLGARQ